jgi:hypothetical protein
MSQRAARSLKAEIKRKRISANKLSSPSKDTKIPGGLGGGMKDGKWALPPGLRYEMFLYS